MDKPDKCYLSLDTHIQKRLYRLCGTTSGAVVKAMAREVIRAGLDAIERERHLPPLPKDARPVFGRRELPGQATLPPPVGPGTESQRRDVAEGAEVPALAHDTVADGDDIPF